MMVFKASDESEAGAKPSEKSLTEMGLVMAEMAEKGVLLAGEGLLPSSRGLPAGAGRAASAGSSTGRSPRPRS